MKIKKFEDLSVSQLYQILKLRVDVFVVEQNCPYQELDNRDQEALHFFEEEDGLIKSYLRVCLAASKSEIGRIVVHPDFRGFDLGRRLLDAAIRYLETKTEIIVLHAQSRLASYYQSFGFETCSDPYDWDGIEHLDMELVNKTS